MPQLGCTNQLTTDNKPAFMYTDGFYMDFDGTDHYLAIGGTSFDNIWASGGTISILFKAPLASSGDVLFSKKDVGTDGWRLTIEDVSSGASDLQFRVDWDGDNLQKQTSVRDIDLSEWNHVVITYDADAYGNTPKFYINGIDQGYANESQPTSGNSVNSDVASHLTIGGVFSSGSITNTIEGQISEIAIWSSVLTETEALRIHSGYQHENQINLDANDGTYNSASDLIGWWRMGDSDGDSYPVIQNCAGIAHTISAAGTLVIDLTGALTSFSTYSNGQNISSGTFETSGSGTGGIQKQALTVDKIYRLVFVHNSGDNIDVKQADNNGANAITLVSNHSASATAKAITFVAKKQYLNFHLDGASESANISVMQLHEYPPDSAAVMVNMDTSNIVSASGIKPITGS